jgi:hypothetical protein
MSEHKNKKQDEIKGSEYRKVQLRLKELKHRGKYVAVASPSDEWYERRFPGYIERKRQAAEKKRKDAELTERKKNTTLIGKEAL